MKTLWRKNQKNSCDRISHAWAPLNSRRSICLQFSNAYYKKIVVPIIKVTKMQYKDIQKQEINCKFRNTF
jgi:hypothetical protein